MMTALWITLGIICSLNFGYRWGRLSWKAWGKKSRSFIGLLCFGFKYFFVTLFDVIIKICSKIIDMAISPSHVVPKNPEEIPEAKALQKKPFPKQGEGQ